MKDRYGILASGYHGYLFVKKIIGMVDVVGVASCFKQSAFDSCNKIKKLCVKTKIPYYKPSELLQKDCVVIVVGWPKLLKRTKSVIVMHDSLLPKYKGHCPTVTALIHGDSTIGVTAFLPNKRADCGKIIAQASISIKYPIKIKKAYELLLPCFIKCFTQHDKTQINFPQTQWDSYSLWRDEEDYFIDWSGNATVINRQIDATGWPYDGARSNTTSYGTTIIRDATPVGDVNIVNRVPGKCLYFDAGKPVIVCGSGLLRIDNAEQLNGNKCKFNKLKERFL